MRTIWAIAAAILCLASGGATLRGQPAEPEPLIGLWAAQRDFGPALRGELSLTRRGGDWDAVIGNSRHRFRAPGNDIRFALPDGRGGFRGRLSGDGRTIDGFWLQPTGETQDRQDPGGSGQRFATPMDLSRIGPNHWRGTVVPLDDRFTLYLKVFRDGENLIGAFRNPELNVNGGASQYRVSRDGERVRFSVSYDGGEIVHDAVLLRGPDRLRIAWPNLGQPLELTRRDPAQASAFFPRPPGAAAYVYRQPEALDDGWPTASASEAGIEEGAVQRLVQGLIDADPAARGPSLIHSLLIARHGKLVVEEYFFGHDRETAHDIRSAGKTFSSVLLGVAMRRGVPISPDTRIYELMRARGPFANPDPRKNGIRLSHLMTHSPGLACDDNNEASPGNEDGMWRQRAQPDFWKYTLDLPMLHDPGTRYAYCSANINLVGGALTEATRTWLPQYFHEQVAVPLQFGRYHWNVTPNGEGYLGGGAFMRPRDLLKIGQTYLDGGVWHGRRIVDAAWIARSTAPVIEINEQTTGLSAEEFGNYYGRGRDALAWHFWTLTSGGRSFTAYAATGNGGQLLLVFPDLDLTAVITGGNYAQGGIWTRWPQRLIGDQIIPALRD